MKAGKNWSSAVKFVSVNAPKLKPFAIKDEHGNETHVYGAQIIRLISKFLHVRYEVCTPPDGAFGAKLPDGNWSGMLGMVHRSEVDLAMGGVVLTEERYNTFNYSYPYVQSKVTFMTDKPEPIPKNFVILYPFSLEIWLVLLTFLIAVSVLFYVLLGRKEPYQNVLLCTFGNLLEKSMEFKVRTQSVRLLACAWLLGILIITNSYKGLLLSFLTFPILVGVRDFTDLSKVSVGKSFTCLAFKGSYMADSFLEKHSWRAIGECLKRNEIASGNAIEIFLNIPPKKAFIGSDAMLGPYARDFFMSDDSYYIEVNGIPFSKKFCCPVGLNRFVHRFVDSGVLQKTLRDETFLLQLRAASSKSSSSRSEVLEKIQLEDMSGAFIVLISGWLLAFVTFFVEIVLKKLHDRKQ